jgi:hypothetical protein
MGNPAPGGKPVRNNKSLKAQFILKDAIEQLAIAACIAAMRIRCGDRRERSREVRRLTSY